MIERPAQHHGRATRRTPLGHASSASKRSRGSRKRHGRPTRRESAWYLRAVTDIADFARLFAACDLANDALLAQRGEDRRTPMPAGLFELLPWVEQPPNEPSRRYNDLGLGDFFEGFFDGECQRLRVTHDDLRAWRSAPPLKRERKTREAGAS